MMFGYVQAYIVTSKCFCVYFYNINPSIKIKCVSYPSEKDVDDGNADIGLVDWIKENIKF